MNKADWVIQVKTSIEHLNKLLAETPEGVDVTVSATKVNDQVGAQSFEFADETKSIWQVKVEATKIERLL
jgi:hypothetical protein